MTNDEMRAGPEESAQPVQESDAATESGVATAPEPSTPNNGQSPEAPTPSGLEQLKPGTIVKGKVRKIVDFGAFIDVGVGRDGLAHISTLKRAGVDQTLKAGDKVDVVVRRVDVENNRISLAIASPDAEPKTPLRDLEPNEVVTGRVVRLVDFGAFVDIGARTDGLLHISQLGSGYVNHPSEVLNVGDEVQVRILDVDTRRRRISLTMKDMGEGGEANASSAQTREASQAQEPSSGERLPTAMEVAFEKARSDARRRRRRS
jgi:transcriptional accessory protein Tex/SPT6